MRFLGIGRPVTRLHLVIAAVLALPAVCGAQESLPPAECRDDALISQRVMAYLEPLVRAGQISGTLLIARGDCVVFEQSFGMADFEHKIPNSPATLFAIASVTKPLTELIADALVKQGRLAMSDSLSKWIPDFPRGAYITLRHLREHRSGLPARDYEVKEERKPRTAEEVVRVAATYQPVSEPGAEFLYGSAGYSVLARVLELAGGKPYFELIREIVFTPAAATHSIDATEQPLPAALAKSYFGSPSGPEPASFGGYAFVVGSGSVYSSPRDLFRIVRALLDTVYGTGAKTALVRWGPAADAQHGDSITWGGLFDGYTTRVNYDPVTRLTFIFCGNLLTGAVRWVQIDVPRIAAGIEAPPRKVPTPLVADLPVAVRHNYEGPYQLGPRRTEDLRFVSPRLARLGSMRLTPTSDTTFFSPQYYTQVGVVRAPDGSVKALTWETIEGARGRWERVSTQQNRR